MAYFSHLALAQDFLGNKLDLSFSAPIMILNCRIEDLERRLEELNERGSPNRYCRISREILPYVLAEHMLNARDVIAIELAQQRLTKELVAERKTYSKEAISPVYLPNIAITPEVVLTEKRKG